ncbi:hypothetical protein CKM354_000929200 [Cercospora kikuchii]|uniref:Stc1 domain-containing protein n=1 Tax=Cercospora kikuchii TaxID=84275 RepID=A0A9P3CXB1_9PEZI|nr:uncharacterized protein CKM354_000929200 [Cercospora kikuchii]GIZ46153.1 hypothetical protein CKM354_000929200 [Cercospora kikuchii]
MTGRFYPGLTRGTHSGRGRGNFSGNATSANAVQTPSLIKCRSCSQLKGWQAFSNRQRNKVLAALAKDPGFDPQVTAIADCSEENRTKFEDKCNNCKKTKGKDSFNKTQWTNTSNEDGGECLRCQLGDQYQPGEHESDIENDRERSESDEDDE